MNSPESLPELASVEEKPQADEAQSAEQSTGLLQSEPDSSMEEYYQLQKELLILTLLFIGVIFIPIWIFYSLDIALNYLIGACTGVVYLKMLARNVEQLGRQKSKLSKAHLALFIGVIVVASQVEQLQILPIFLGFFTYKAALIFYMLRTLSIPKP